MSDQLLVKIENRVCTVTDIPCL